MNTLHDDAGKRAGAVWGKAAGLALLAWCCASSATGADADNARVQRKLDPRVPRYFVTKEREARALAKQLNVQVPPEVGDYFAAGARGDCAAADVIFNRIFRQWRAEQKRSVLAGPMMEAELACECFTGMEVKFIDAIARDVIGSIPRGSIYFGGTDPGRGVMTAFVKSLPKADPFFVLSQNPLGDITYLDYVRAMYGRRIYIPSKEDWQKVMDDYGEDARERMEADQLKPGENVSEGEDGKVRPSSYAAWMEVNALLVKLIFEKNPRHEFYLEESMPMDWMYPHLSPHGLILKVSRQPLTEMSEKAVKENRAFWRAQTKRLLGDWLTNETPVKVLCEFVEDVYGQAQLDGFKGDKDYVLATRGRDVQFYYAHLRNAQGHVYKWRMDHAKTPGEKERMMRELDFTCRQAIALCPYNVETVKRYVNLLRDQKRLDDAQQMLRTGRMINPRSTRLQDMAEELEEN